MARSSFDKKSFLKKGAIFGSEDSFYLFWGEDSWCQDRPNEPSIATMDFFSKEVIWKKYENFCSYTRGELKSMFSKEKQTFDWQIASKELFINMFTQTQETIATGELDKLVPYILYLAKRVDHKSISLEALLGNSLTASKGYLYGEWKNDSGFLGLTPELLVEVKDQSLSTMALAGTCDIDVFSKNPQAFLLDEKEAYEHQKVVDDLAIQLKSFGQVQVSKREVQEAPKLVHLKTNIKLEPFEGAIEEIVARLHPTPALGSFPRKSGEKYLRQWDEKIPRGVFGAPFGFSKDESHCLFVVAIRNVIWNKMGLNILTGCGVVKESQLEREWQELQNKRDSIKEIFGVV